MSKEPLESEPQPEFQSLVVPSDLPQQSAYNPLVDSFTEDPQNEKVAERLPQTETQVIEPTEHLEPRVTMTATEQRELLNQSKQSSTFGGQSLIENNLDLQSSASFNIDMFKGLDSISAVGDNTCDLDQVPLEQFDLGTIKFEL